ncbi:hypothetical protein [Nannocystis pusilla]|uniref:hypothetical protein n=1 Tax=Nannocystis pusilla TaxID=889268 RepID=UPI003BF30820
MIIIELVSLVKGRWFQNDRGSDPGIAGSPRRGRLDREAVGLADLVRALLGGHDDVVPAVVHRAEHRQRAGENATALVERPPADSR